MRISQRLAERRAMRHRNDSYCRVDISPLITIVLILLVVLVSAPIPHHGGTFGILHLPVARNASPTIGAQRDDALLVAVPRDGAVYVGTTQVPRDILADALRVKFSKTSEKRLYLGVDAKTRYSDVCAVLDGTQLAGIQDISVMTRSN